MGGKPCENRRGPASKAKRTKTSLETSRTSRASPTAWTPRLTTGQNVEESKALAKLTAHQCQIHKHIEMRLTVKRSTASRRWRADRINTKTRLESVENVVEGINADGVIARHKAGIRVSVPNSPSNHMDSPRHERRIRSRHRSGQRLDILRKVSRPRQQARGARKRQQWWLLEFESQVGAGRCRACFRSRLLQPPTSVLSTSLRAGSTMSICDV